MLVITRRVGEEIVIGGNIVVRVLQLNSKVRLGITAPDDVPVDRREIDNEIRRTGKRIRQLQP